MPISKIVKKHELDKFYTKTEVAKICIEKLVPYISDQVLIEPSAGNGAFSKQIECRAYDVAPDDPSIIKQDYLKSPALVGEVCVFGNPPFGRRNDLCKAFIKHSLGVRTIAFILPCVFEKSTYQKTFPPEWFLVENLELPKNSFLLNNTEYHVPCVFQIWIKDWTGNNLRKPIINRISTDDFTIVGKNEKSDLFVFGAAPNKFIHPTQVNEKNRGYYLAITPGSVEDVKHNLSRIDWKNFGKSSVNGGVFWLTKTEFIEAYEQGKILC